MVYLAGVFLQILSCFGYVIAWRSDFFPWPVIAGLLGCVLCLFAAVRRRSRVLTWAGGVPAVVGALSWASWIPVLIDPGDGSNLNILGIAGQPAAAGCALAWLASRWQPRLTYPWAGAFTVLSALAAAGWIFLPVKFPVDLYVLLPAVGTLQMCVALCAKDTWPARLSAVAGALVFIGVAYMYPLFPLVAIGLFLGLVAAGFEVKERLATR
ncbi:hypothetical protein GCM10028828_09070 [Corynebacterium tapiri]